MDILVMETIPMMSGERLTEEQVGGTFTLKDWRWGSDR